MIKMVIAVLESSFVASYWTAWKVATVLAAPPIIESAVHGVVNFNK